jgi:hypothetical protein
MSVTPFKIFERIKGQLESNSLCVEIGSDRGSGSTQYLQQLANDTLGNSFITIDIDPIHLDSKIRAATMTGEQWVVQHLPDENKKIGLVFLDGSDWIEQPILVRNGSASPDVYNMIGEYHRKGSELNNINTTIAHTKQILGMLPYMQMKCAVLLGDTKFNFASDSFSGKGAAAVYILLSEGFCILSASRNSNCVLMARGMREESLPHINMDALSVKYSGPQKRADSIVYINDE